MIGIVTPYKTLNYGTKLQAYAMQELMKKYGKCEIIRFNTSNDYRLSAIIGKISYSNIKNKFLTKLNNKKSSEEYIRILNNRNREIASFDNYYTFSKTLNNNKELTEYSKKIDTLVCGSDQLWSPANVKNDWFTLNIFSERISKNSYAASFGVSSIPKRMEKKYKKFLSKFDHIAVREIDGKQIVKSVSNKEATVTLDPTLMLDCKKWSELASNSKIKINKPYVFCYFLGTNIKHREFAYNLAKKNGYELVNLPFIKCENKADKQYKSICLDKVSPVDFIHLIQNAEFVCTDSFHGTAFSVLFKKEFVVFERFSKEDIQSTNSRIYSILNLLGLNNRLVSEVKDINFLEKEKINYSNVLKKLEEEKKKSFDYLNNVFAEKR